MMTKMIPTKIQTSNGEFRLLSAYQLKTPMMTKIIPLKIQTSNGGKPRLWYAATFLPVDDSHQRTHCSSSSSNSSFEIDLRAENEASLIGSRQVETSVAISGSSARSSPISPSASAALTLTDSVPCFRRRIKSSTPCWYLHCPNKAMALLLIRSGTREISRIDPVDTHVWQPFG